jgi:hypothetical protein
VQLVGIQIYNMEGFMFIWNADRLLVHIWCHIPECSSGPLLAKNLVRSFHTAVPTARQNQFQFVSIPFLKQITRRPFRNDRFGAQTVVMFCTALHLQWVWCLYTCMSRLSFQLSPPHFLIYIYIYVQVKFSAKSSPPSDIYMSRLSFQLSPPHLLIYIYICPS